MIQKSILIALALILYGCEKNDPGYYDGRGKQPVYLSLGELLDIRNEPPKSIELSGTIYLKDSLFFILEQRKGIHVFNIIDSSNSVNLTFLKIPAITDFTILDNILYADSWKDLVVIDISNLQQIRETARIKDVINPVLYPLLYNGVFECADDSKGAIVDWVDATLTDAKCSTE